MSIKDLAIQAHEAAQAVAAAKAQAERAEKHAQTVNAARQWFAANIATPDSVEITKAGYGDVVVTLDGMTFHWGSERHWQSYGEPKRFCCVLLDDRLPRNHTGQTTTPYSKPIYNLAGLGKVLKSLEGK